MSTIFNRRDTAVIEFALNNSLKAFLEKYSSTSANEATLTKAHNEIVGNKTKSNIAVKSGAGKPDEPLAPIDAGKPQYYALDEDGEIKKVDTTNIPTRTALSSPEKAKAEGRRPGIVSVDEDKSAKKKSGPVKSKAKSDKKGVAPIKKATLADGTEATGSKRDAIKALLANDPQMSNKDVKAAILSQGFKSCYDSEISAAKK